MPPPNDESQPVDAELEARLRRALSEPAPTIEEPPAHLWDGIEAELGLSSPPSPDRPDPTGSVSRRGLLAGIAGGVAAGALAGGAATWLMRRDDLPREVETEVELAPLEDLDDVRGRARLVREGSALFLDIRLDAEVSNPDGYIEVWLINEDLTRMITVGTFPPGQEVRLQLDPELIAQHYTIVDLSYEPYDDDPAHSGVTILRSTQTL